VRIATAQFYEQLTNQRCANGTRPIALIGDIDDATCLQISTVATLLHVPTISPGCRDPQFAFDRDSYPFFARTITNLKAEGDALHDICLHFGTLAASSPTTAQAVQIADVCVCCPRPYCAVLYCAALYCACARLAGWKSVVHWHTGSLFGSALLRPLLEPDDIEVIDVPISASDEGKEATRTLRRIAALRIRLIVVHAEPQAARMMMSVAHDMGFLNGDYIFLGSTSWTYGTVANPLVFTQSETRYLQGIGPLSSRPLCCGPCGALFDSRCLLLWWRACGVCARCARRVLCVLCVCRRHRFAFAHSARDGSAHSDGPPNAAHADAVPALS
jgi:hypothetical protein